MNDKCFASCYQKYLETFQHVNATFRKIGYDVHSTIAYKCYPEDNPYFEAYYGDLFLTQKNREKFAYNFVTNKFN